MLRTWDNAAIAARRVELQGRLSSPTDPKARDELLGEYQAIEWVAHERGLALPKDPGEEAAPQAYSGGAPIKFWVPDTAQGMRAMLEREMAAGTGYDAAREHAQLRIDYGTLPRSETDNDKRLIGEQQSALMDRDAAAFRGAFRREARHTALSMLDASTVAIDSTLRSYGIASGAFRLTDAAHKVAREPGALDAEVDQWVALSSRLESNRAAFAAGHGQRDDLSREARQLRDLQDSIAALSSEQLRLTTLVQSEHPQHPGMPQPPSQSDWRALDARSAQRRPMQGSVQNPFEQLSAPATASPDQRLEFVRGALGARRAQFQAAWIQAERQHPVLAAYRGTKTPDASSLTELTDPGTDEATTRSVVHHVLPKLGNIYRAKAALLGSWGTLDPLQLTPAVELTKQRMFVPDGSTRDRVVHDMVAESRDKHDPMQWALEAVMLSLTLVTLVPTGGASAAAGLALTGLAYDLYMGMGEYEDVQTNAAASDTDLDKLRSLSDLEPSLTPLLTRIVSAGINLTAAAGLFKRAVNLRRMAINGKIDPEAITGLNQAGEAAGVQGIGDEAIASAHHETDAGAAAPSRPVSESSAEGTEAGKSHLGPAEESKQRPAAADRHYKVANEVSRGRDLPEFPVAKHTLTADNDEKGNHFAVIFSAATVDNQAISLGEAIVQLANDGGATDLPWLRLDATIRRDGKDYAVRIFDSVAPREGLPPGPIGNRASLTEYALQTFIGRYKARFGHEPTAFFGQLIESNRENFQREYVRLLSSGAKPNVAKIEAVKRISFGQHRMALGYTDFEVDLEGFATVDLGAEFGVRKNVPTSIEVTARKP
jgi:hypothetical protein